MEYDLAAHDLSLHVWGFVAGVIATVGGLSMTVLTHRERKRDREDERKWEEMYERTRPRGQEVR